MKIPFLRLQLIGLGVILSVGCSTTTEQQESLAPSTQAQYQQVREHGWKHVHADRAFVVSLSGECAWQLIESRSRRRVPTDPVASACDAAKTAAELGARSAGFEVHDREEGAAQWVVLDVSSSRSQFEYEPGVDRWSIYVNAQLFAWVQCAKGGWHYSQVNTQPILDSEPFVAEDEIRGTLRRLASEAVDNMANEILKHAQSDAPGR